MREKQSGKTTTPSLPELLAPAGSFEKLAAAVHYGADAVYLGGSRFGLRTRAGTFDEAGIEAAVTYAHERGVKVYVTVNIFAHNRDFSGLAEYLERLGAAGADGIIVSDPGIIGEARRIVPDLPLHLSTQANVTNSSAAAFWAGLGITRINLARELSFPEIAAIRRRVGCELEVFVHGALCISYSGRCLLSQYLTGRDANKGNCAHPCRYSYTVLEEKRPDEYFPVEEDERGTYIFNSKDLCLLRRLPLLVHGGVNAVKIEGRMKSLFYVGSVVRAYRNGLDYLAALDGSAWLHPERIEMPEELLAEIAGTGTRELTENFFSRRPGAAEMLYRTSRSEQRFEPVAVVRGASAEPLVEIRTVLQRGDVIEYMHRSPANEQVRVVAMRDESGDEISRANPGSRVVLHLSGEIRGIEAHGIFRRRREWVPAPDRAAPA